jgi:hypothetical protein
MTFPMRRYGLVAALSFSLILLGAACRKNVPQPNGAECEIGPVTTPTGEQVIGLDPSQCEGRVCLELNDNAQGVDGICSERCQSDADCTPHEECTLIEGETFCLRACVADDDCYDRTVCRLFAPGNPTRFCLADPL